MIMYPIPKLVLKTALKSACMIAGVTATITASHKIKYIADAIGKTILKEVLL